MLVQSKLNIPHRHITRRHEQSSASVCASVQSEKKQLAVAASIGKGESTEENQPSKESTMQTSVNPLSQRLDCKVEDCYGDSRVRISDGV